MAETPSSASTVSHAGLLSRSERPITGAMSIDEQEQSLGKAVHAIKKKIEERNQLRKHVQFFVDAFGKILACYKQENRSNEELAMLLKQLPQDNPTVSTFLALIEAESDLACLQRTLGLTIKEAQ